MEKEKGEVDFRNDLIAASRSSDKDKPSSTLTRKNGFWNPLNSANQHFVFTTPFVEIWDPAPSNSSSSSVLDISDEETRGGWFYRAIGSGVALETKACLYARNIIHGLALLHCTTVENSEYSKMV
jgi:hypothetical protein